MIAFSPYPFSVGPKRVGMVVHAGINPYVVVTTGPLAGGDVLSAKEFGLEWLEHVFGGVTSDGLYRVEPINPTTTPVTSVKLRWTVVSTGLQAGAIDLSASVVNLVAVGW